MRKLHPMIAAFAAVTLAFAGCQQQGAEEGTTDEMAADSVDNEAALEDMAAAYEDAFAARDWDAVMALHTDDYEEITSEGETMGYDDVNMAMRDSTQQPPEGAALTITPESFEVSEGGDLAYGTGTTTFTATGPDGQQMTEESRWMAGFQKVDGEWKIDRLVTVPMGGGAMGGDMMGDTDEGGMDDGGAMEEDTTAM